MFAVADARFFPASDRSLIVYLGEDISPATNLRVIKLLRQLESCPIDGVRNLHPAYNSLLLVFDPLRLRHDELEHQLRGRIQNSSDLPDLDPRQVEIPVCYGGAFGPDLDELARLHAISSAQVIELHAAASYRVYFLGFAPGFAYLGGLPQGLATPRLASPRKAVPAGSVGIADTQTGVYPFSTPGGWRLIGRTPLRMFRPDRHPVSLLAIGDEVRFRPISEDEFTRMAHSSP